MPHPTGPSNPNTRKLIAELRKSREKDLAEIARHLARPARSKRPVNLSRLSKMARHDSFVVPGKVLSLGGISRPINVYAWSFSKSAKSKIEKAGGKAFTLKDFLKEKAKAKIVV